MIKGRPNCNHNLNTSRSRHSEIRIIIKRLLLIPNNLPHSSIENLNIFFPDIGALEDRDVWQLNSCPLPSTKDSEKRRECTLGRVGTMTSPKPDCIQVQRVKLRYWHITRVRRSSILDHPYFPSYSLGKKMRVIYYQPTWHPLGR